MNECMPYSKHNVCDMLLGMCFKTICEIKITWTQLLLLIDGKENTRWENV